MVICAGKTFAALEGDGESSHELENTKLFVGGDAPSSHAG
ncbi:hypothetical protein SynNOUM97013_00927 [Synechococcus sp. NOUM97013]|nr:hypothetical protein SynNOUM97013_00927 [Synechococcus sp. NOUM97013]